MRLLHVAPSIERAYGGPTRSLGAFLRAAGEAGIAATVAAPRCSAQDLEAFQQDAPAAEVVTFPAYGRGAAIVAPALLRWLARSGGRFDVVHVHGLLNPISSLAAGSAVAHGWPLVVRPFGTLSRYTFEHRRGRLKRLYFASLDGPNLRRAGAVHFTTAAEQEQAEWHGLALGARGHVVPPFVEVGACAALPAQPDAAASPTALFLSRLHPVKNLELLLEAWARVTREMPGARLVIAGDGVPAYVRRIRGLAAERVGNDSVAFSGFLSGEAKARALRSARVFVLPSRHENFGFAVLEALAAGVPVVITPEVQLSSFVEARGLGAVVPAQPAALAQALLHALRDDALARSCRTRGPEQVARAFSRRQVAAGLHTMYQAAITSTIMGRP